MRRTVVLVLATIGLVSACSPSTPSPSAPVTEPSATTAPSSAGPLGSIVASGFGQRDKYVWVTAVVHNNTQKVGQTVTVNFNVLDASGTILKSGAQGESFSQPAVDHIVGTQLDLETGQKAASVEATLLVEDRGSFSATQFPAMPVTTPVFKADQYGATVVSFELSNTQSSPVSSPRILITPAMSAI